MEMLYLSNFADSISISQQNTIEFVKFFCFHFCLTTTQSDSDYLYPHGYLEFFSVFSKIRFESDSHTTFTMEQVYRFGCVWIRVGTILYEKYSSIMRGNPVHQN